MNILQGEIENSHWLDLFSGSGVVGCEALQKGARRICSVESNKSVSAICKSNLLSTAAGVFQKSFIEVFSTEVNRFLKEGCKKNSMKFTCNFPNSDPRFDFIYVDPPYESDLYLPVLNNLICGGWLKKHSLIICEYSQKCLTKFPTSWEVRDKKNYGNSCIVLLTPNQA